MKKMKKQRKGFTLTELAIVIAVIAILIAVLVPTFTSLISKANESADKQMIKNINTTLITEDTISGISTPSDALDAVEEVGYSLEKLTPTSEDNYIVYDQTTKTFALLDSDGNTLYSYNDVTIDPESPSTWWIVSSTSEMTSTTRSYILTGDIASTASASTSGVNLAKTSVNGGHKAVASSMSYDNDGVLTYTGFGGIDTYNVTSNITKVVYDFSNASVAEKYASYYVTNNFVININIPATLVEIKTSVSLVIDSHGAEDTVVKVTASSGATVTVNDYSGAIYVESSSVTVTSATTTTVTTITETEYSSASTSSGTLELGNEQYPWLIESVDEWLEICTLDVNSEETTYPILAGYYWKVTTNLDFTSSEYTGATHFVTNLNGHIDFDNHKVTLVEEAYTAYDTDSYALIHEMFGGSISNLNIELCGLYKVVNYVYMHDGDVTLSNITVSGSRTVGANNEASFVGYVVGYGNNYVLTLKDCTNKGTIVSSATNSASIFVGKVVDWGKINHTGLHETYVLSSSELSAYESSTSSYNPYSYAYIVFDTCVNATEGKLVHTEGYASMLIANGATFVYDTLNHIKVIDCENNGTIKTPGEVNLLCGSGWTGNVTLDEIKSWISSNSSNLEDNGTLAVLTVTNLSTDNGYYTLSTIKGNDEQYTITFSFWVAIYTDSNKTTELGHGSYTITITVDNTESLDLDKLLLAYDWVSESSISGSTSSITVDKSSLTTYAADGSTTYYVFDTDEILNGSDSYVVISDVTLSVYGSSLSNFGTYECTVGTLTATTTNG